MGQPTPHQSPDADRYSPVLDRRYQAALRENGARLKTRMPFACFGTGNGFLALLGPSMGGAGDGEAVCAGGPNRPRGNRMKIGFQDQELFPWRDQRSVRWRRLCTS